jgi:hypothetical protein
MTKLVSTLKNRIFNRFRFGLRRRIRRNFSMLIHIVRLEYNESGRQQKSGLLQQK